MVNIKFIIKVTIDFYGVKKPVERYKEEVMEWYRSHYRYCPHKYITNFDISFISDNKFEIKYTTSNDDTILEEMKEVANPVPEHDADEYSDEEGIARWPYLTIYEQGDFGETENLWMILASIIDDDGQSI